MAKITNEINNNELKYLYQKSIEKWERIAEDFDDFYKSLGNRCSFCIRASNDIYDSNPESFSFPSACDICHINHFICDCNMAHLEKNKKGLYHKVMESLRVAENEIKMLINALYSEKNKLEKNKN